tara:strand:+ start:2375 stop:2647 length:273 start_codon:yes stop_codon:yes gene_type:complete
MIKKLLFLTTVGLLLSGCFMTPMAFIGPATSGFSTASITQSGFSSAANYIYKKNTGKTLMEHALITLNKKKKESILKSIKQTYYPTNILP